MRTIFYLNEKKISKRKLEDMLGKERLKRMLDEAKETFREDPLIQNSFFLGSNDMLTIEFDV